jgi:hypothetical protein
LNKSEKGKGTSLGLHRHLAQPNSRARSHSRARPRVGQPSKVAAASATLPTLRRRSHTPASPTAGPRRSHSLTGETRLHPLPPARPNPLLRTGTETERGQGHAPHEGGIPSVPFAPSTSRARQATTPVPHASRLRSPNTHRAREADAAMAAKSDDTALHRQPSVVFDFGISNSNHASSNHPSTSQDGISTLRAFRLPSHRLPCHGRARSIKLHPVPCPSPFQPFRHHPGGTTAHTTSQGGKGRKGEAARKNRARGGGAPSELVGDEGGAARFLLRHGTARHGSLLTPHQLALHRYPFAIATYGELTISPRSLPVVLGIKPPRLSVPWII